MTKGECIALLDRYANYNGVGIQNLEGCREAMLKAVELLSQPSLPSDIDDATMEKITPKQVKAVISKDLKKRGLSQKEIGERIGFGRQTVSNILSGDKYFTSKQAILFNLAFGYNKEFLMTGIGDLSQPDILLTEDILEKNGFKPDNGSALSWSLQDDLYDTILKLFKISNAFVLPTVGMTIAIQYVHELQMLFELCGIKRQIKI